LLADAMREVAQQRFLAEPFPASIEEIERQRAARRSLAEGVMQRMSAETPAIAQYAAMLVAARRKPTSAALQCATTQ
jgi:anthranilate phosphoribosyltransferase